MIRQRNLSLLANRLLKEHGGRRIPESVLERDYCLAWFLAGFSQCSIQEALIFKGGTAVKRCHFGDYRFSEDLDFTLVRKMEAAEIQDRLNEVYDLVANESGIRFAFEREDRQKHVNSYTFYLRYEGPLPAPNNVKVDITLNEILVFPVERLPVLQAYGEFQELPKTEESPSTASMRSRSLRSKTEPGTSPGTYTIFGTLPLTLELPSVILLDQSLKNCNSAVKHWKDLNVASWRRKLGYSLFGGVA